MRRLGIVAVGLALVVGIVVGSIVGNLFGAIAPRTSAAAVTGSGCYTNWNDDTCAPGFTPVSTGMWTAVVIYDSSGPPPHSGATMICAAAKSLFAGGQNTAWSDTTPADDGRHYVDSEPCAICCGTGPSVVGGFAELPALAGPAGTSGMGGATYAVLAGAAAGVLAFAVLATLSVKRWRVR